MLLRYERDSASVGNSASLLHNTEAQGEPMT